MGATVLPFFAVTLVNESTHEVVVYWYSGSRSGSGSDVVVVEVVVVVVGSKDYRV